MGILNPDDAPSVDRPRLGTCGNCRYFSAMQKQCRKQPPTLIPIQNPNGMGTIGTWPPTKDSDWCGEHAPDVSLAS